MPELDWCPWPRPDEPGRYLAGCSCGRWQAEGTAAEVSTASRQHDDSPWRSHVVTIRGRVRERG